MGYLRESRLCWMKKPQKASKTYTKKKMVIDRRKRSKATNKVKPVKNINRNLQIF